MKSKAFFKPTPIVAITFVVLMVATSIPSNLLVSGADIGANHGIPLSFYGYGGGPPLASGQPMPVYYNYVGLLIDIAVWYIVACVLSFAYHKATKK